MVHDAQVSATRRRNGDPELGANYPYGWAAAHTRHCSATRQRVAAGVSCRGALAILLHGALGKIQILHLGDSVLAPLGCLAKLLKIPVCVTVHGLDVTYANPLYRLWLRVFFTRLDAYICVSAAARVAAIASGAPAARTSVVGMGVTPVSVLAAKREPDLLLFVGRLVPRKGLEWFVRMVMPRLVQRRPGVRLAIIGAGSERATIRATAVVVSVEDRIEWLGTLTDVERSQWFARAAVCILPNVHVPGDLEGYGIVALEAAAAGCPLVASDLEGLRDAIIDGKGGRLVPTEDAAAWTAAITELLDDPIRAEAAGARARAWVRAERDWEAVCDRYEAIFNSRVNGKTA